LYTKKNRVKYLNGMCTHRADAAREWACKRWLLLKQFAQGEHSDGFREVKEKNLDTICGSSK
jgi:hypothetical protein